MRWQGLCVVVLALAAVGCPQPTPGKTAKTGPGKTAAPEGSQPAGGDGAKTEGGEGSKTGGGDTTGSEGPAPSPWKIIPDELLADEHFYPQLKPTASWPDPTGLKAVDAAPAAKQPSKTQIRTLKELVELCVHPSYQPKDMDAALGLDEQGRLFCRLGKSKTVGSASTATVPEGSKFPVFALTFQIGGKGPHTMDSLTKRVAKVVNPGLVEEINKTEGSRFAPSPRVKGEKIAAGLAILDPAGKFGIQFRYVYVFGDDDHLIVLLQEVPHMSAAQPR